jgi:hypothetical protein
MTQAVQEFYIVPSVHKFSFINDLCESRLIPSKSSLKGWDVKKISELVYLYFLGLRMLLHDTNSRSWAQDYCKKTGENADFATWRTSGNDLYVMLYALTGDPDDTDEKISLPHRINISPNIIRQWLRNSTNKGDTQIFFNRLDSMFMIDNSSMKSMRRLLTNMDDMSDGEKKSSLDKIIQLITSRVNSVSNSEILSHLKELKFGTDDKKINEYLTLKQFESASSGGTSSASVATVVGGLGAGFDPDGDWRSVYGKKKAKKPIIIKRAT